MINKHLNFLNFYDRREDATDTTSDHVFAVAPSEGQKPIGILSDKHFEEMCNPNCCVAGVLNGAWPCGIITIVSECGIITIVSELFRAESKSQVCGSLHQ